MVLLGILVLCVFILARLSDKFFTVANLLTSTRYAVEVGLIGIPMTMIIITRGIDLSVASNLALSAMLLGLSWRNLGLSIWAAALVGLAVGTLGGLLNGLVVAKLRVPPLVVTLATLAVYRGVATGLGKGRGVTGFPEEFSFLGHGTIGPAPVQLLIWVLAIVLAAIVLARTAFGRQLYAIGHNELAARFAGVNVDRLKVILYTLSGFLCGLAAAIYVARVETAKSNAATGYELRVITAVVLGGTNINGGEGSVLGTTLGVLIVTVLNNGLNLARVPDPAQDVLIGCVLVLAVLAYQRRRS
ncbi:MAG: ABC transporter permease [Deinococcus sp.]|nr:ABC transporter permease [Deinococcus sp.]